MPLASKEPGSALPAPRPVATVQHSLKLWLKAQVLRAQAQYVRAFRSYDAAELTTVLRELGVQSGDSVMLHSAFSRLHGFRGSVEQLIDVFESAVGAQGHLLMVSLPYRSSSFDYLSKGKAFDVRKTPSMMGLPSEIFRRRPNVTRSLHPTHPVLVRGPRVAWFVDDHPRCAYPCGPDSPFDRLHAADGKVVFFNVAFDNYTFFHYLEHLVSPHLPFPLYTDRPFEAQVVDRDGQRRTVPTFVFAPDAIRRRRFDAFEAALRQRGLITNRRLGASQVQLVRVRDTVDCVMDMARRGEFFYDLSDKT